MNRRKLTIYLAVIGVGLVAVIVDHTLGPSPSSSRVMASDVLPDTNSLSRANLTLSPKTVPTLTVTGTPFPHFPVEPNADANERDPFAVPPSFTEAEAGGEEVNTTTKAPSVRFLEDHQLSAIMMVDGSRVAVVNGLIVAEGQRLDGCELRHVAPRLALFACPDAEARLIIESTLPVKANAPKR